MGRLNPKLQEALDATGLPWEIEEGTKHRKVRICGRLVLIMSRAGAGEDASQRIIRNNLANIRRAVREIKEAL